MRKKCFLIPAGGGTFLFRQESTQRTDLRKALRNCSRKNRRPSLRILPAALNPQTIYCFGAEGKSVTIPSGTQKPFDNNPAVHALSIGVPQQKFTISYNGTIPSYPPKGLSTIAQLCTNRLSGFLNKNSRYRTTERYRADHPKAYRL